MDLNSPISDLPNVGPILTKKFNKLGIHTIENLFYHVPSHYIDYSQIIKISDVKVGETVTLHAKIVSIINQFTKKGVRMQIGQVEDISGKLSVVWFNQPFLTKTLYPGRLVSLSGKVTWFNKKPALFSPEFELMSEEDSETVHTGRLVPTYPETLGLSSKWIRRIVKNAYRNIEIVDFLPVNNLKKSIELVHFPENLEDVEIGKKRLALNELLFLELKSLMRKKEWNQNKSKFQLKINKSVIDKFIDTLPFKLTDSQKTAINEILDDLKVGRPMNRLLEGDVGSGKTVVAGVAAYATHLNGYKTIIMAPTQILAEQHYKTVKQLISGAKIELVTSNSKEFDKNADIFIGTHALITSKIDLKKVGLVVIDEQHRFGVEQRTHFMSKESTPHILTMTATPIPRTIALTSYGDLDLSVLSEVPIGRQKITTWAVPDSKRKGAYEWINKQITNNKSQMFVICPLIDDSEKETMKNIKSVTTQYNNLRSKINNLKFGLLHGRMKSQEKNDILDRFRKGDIDVLVATPVVEVGIDIPNATIMLIESAERFGLAQLHQLRGRVGRGDKKSYCLLFSNFHSGNAFARLKAMEKMHSGFELAELDLKLRGPGEIFGNAQSGFNDLKIASWNDIALIKEARDIAKDIIANPQNYPLIAHKLIIAN